MTRMLTRNEIDQRASAQTQKVLSILHSLNDTAEGRILYNIVYQLLIEEDKQQNLQQQKFQNLFSKVIDFCSKQFGENHHVTLRLDILKTIAEPPFSDISLEALLSDVPDPVINTPGVKNPAENTLSDVVKELLDEPAFTETKEKNTGNHNKKTNQKAIQQSEKKSESTSSYSDYAKSVIPEERIVEQTSQDLSQLRQNLLSRLQGTSGQYEEFSDVLSKLLDDLKDADSADKLSTLRNVLKRRVRGMIKEHRTLSDDIKSSGSEIEKFEVKCQQLNRELSEAKQMSLTDELTGLPNRRSFLRRLANETGRVQRYGYPLAVAMLDLDLFKEINDTYGHETGDAVLKTYTDSVLSTFRNYDMVARYGGEEFAVLLPHTDAKGAERALNKVRKCAMETFYQVHSTKEQIALPTFSAGVAMYNPGEPPSSLIDRADKAMYEAKRQGRNRVELLTGS